MSRSLILIYVLCILPAVISPVYSQLVPVNLTKYSETDGNNIYDVISDQYGFIWMATENGLIKFDGYEFTRFYSDPNDSSSISQILNNSLLEDSKGRIWIGGLQDINVYHPSTGSFTSYPFGNLVGLTEQEMPIITTITENTNGTIYFGAQSFYGVQLKQGLLYFNESSNSVQKVPGLRTGNGISIFSSTSDAFGNSWFKGRDSFIRINENGTVEHVDLAGFSAERPDQQSVIQSDKEGNIWMSYEPSSLVKYQPGTKSYNLYHLDSFTGTAYEELYIISIEIDAENKIWLATDKGIFHFDESTSSLTGFSENDEDSFTQVLVSSLDFDSFGNIWIGTYSNGLMKYEEKSYFRSVKSSLNTNSEITAGWVNIIHESSDGSLWFCTTGFGDFSGINKMDPQTGNVVKYPFPDLMENFYGINDIDSISPNNFLLTSYTGLFNLDLGTMNIERDTTHTLPDSITVLNKYHRDRFGTEWIATAHGLYSRRKEQSQFTFHDLSELENATPLSNEVMQVVESELHGIWLLTNFGLFNANLQTGEITRHGYDQSAGDIFISQDINSIYDDERGIVWVGTWQGGLSRYLPGKGEIKNYTRSDGLPSMGIQYILHDPGQNDLWLSTFEGISRFNIDTEEFINFTTDDGIHSQLFADGSGLKTRDGQFIFGGSGGYTIFKPANIIQNSVPPAVSLTGFSVSNKKLEFDEGLENVERIELKHKENTFSIGFAAIHYSNPDRNKIKYILKNYDQEWHQAANQKFAYYSGLPPGTYNFEVIAANSQGTWNSEGAKLEIKILPPWWQTWTAYGFYAVFFIGGVFSVDHYQRKRLLEKERKKTREKELQQAKEIEKAYHNLEVAHERLKSAQSQLVQQEKLASLGQLTAGIAHEIKNPLNFVNNFSDVSLELIEEALEEISHLEKNKHSEEVRDLLVDIQSNLTKIHQHGSRANIIVSSMLEHSRGGSGKMEPTNINAVIKEYVNLAYHGMRAGKEPIDVEIIYDLDEKMEDVNLIREEFSRVLINLAKNAFDAMREKVRIEKDYKPMLTITTNRRDQTIEVAVADNGPGIPENIKDKILNPFFTTKKGTEGTGLGLSITHDIIKAHGGELNVQTTKNEGSVFTVKLPRTPPLEEVIQVKKQL